VVCALVVCGAAGVFALSACGGSDEEAPTDGSTDTVSAVEAASQIAELSGRLAALAGEVAEVETAAAAKRLAPDFAAVRAEAEATADRVGAAPARGGSLVGAAEAAADAARELEETTDSLADAMAEREREREPSDEAQAEVARAARDARGLTVRVTTASELLGAAIRRLDRGLRQLAADPELATDARRRLGDVRKQLPRLADNAKGATASLQRRVREEARLLTSRSEELTPEPPDVVLDCVSTIETAADVSVRNMTCAEADALILQAIPLLAPSFSLGEFSCTILGDYGPPEGPILGASDVRCESGDRAFRFGFAD
jgi:hypothetical protein